MKDLGIVLRKMFEIFIPIDLSGLSDSYELHLVVFLLHFDLLALIDMSDYLWARLEVVFAATVVILGDDVYVVLLGSAGDALSEEILPDRAMHFCFEDGFSFAFPDAVIEGRLSLECVAIGGVEDLGGAGGSEAMVHVNNFIIV